MKSPVGTPLSLMVSVCALFALLLVGGCKSEEKGRTASLPPPLVGVMTVRCGDNSVVGGIVFMRGRIAHSGVFFIRMIVTVLISMRGPMVMAVLFGLMVVTVLFLCAAQQAHSLRRFHGNQFFIGKPRQNVRNPVLHPSTV
mgnify:CR=1 FL=1